MTLPNHLVVTIVIVLILAAWSTYAAPFVVQRWRERVAFALTLCLIWYLTALWLRSHGLPIWCPL